MITDRFARVFITVGGIGTIVAVALVCVFLVWVVVPLFTSESVKPAGRADIATTALPGAPIRLAIDEYRNIAWLALSDGSIQTYRPSSGELLSHRALFGDQRPTAWSFALREGHIAYALEDHTVQLGTISFRTTYVPEDELTGQLRQLKVGQAASFRDGIVERTPENQFRLQQLSVDLQDPVKVETESGIALIDLSVSSKGTIFAVLTKTGQLRIAKVTQRKNLLTGKVTTQLTEGKVAVALPSPGLPEYLMLGGLGDSVFLVWNDGTVQRFDTRNVTRPVLAETLDLVEEPDGRLTALSFLIGKTSLVSGDSLGRVRIWFRTKPDDAKTPDGSVLVVGHELPRAPGPVSALAPSPRSRMLAATYTDGSARLFHVTSEQILAQIDAHPDVGPIQALAISPKDDGIFALAGRKLLLWDIHAPHPEITWSSIFLPVWYEGYNEPADVWQSSSGTDEFEPKYGLFPLVFGTLKATLYSMMFGAPLAVLAAIYTSEFLHARTRSRVKPTIEIMASLPSVVLGFLAALFFAPLVEDIVPECLTAFVSVPFAYLLGAYLWQLLPARIATGLQGLRLVAMVVALPAGLVLAWFSGRWVERWLFAGDVRAWLDGQIGSGAGAWMFLLLPLSGLATLLVLRGSVTPALRRFAGDWPRTSFALLDLAKFLAGCAATVLLAFSVSWLLDAIGWDPRGTYVDTYIQRNALVVGFIMGFAIIPIIYTISDDALTAVPESLRAASLASGATPWQTAIRIVIPTAMSGLFSAMMVGLGRAVGETMIVLMAAGNTPVMDWNIFNGFRTLSANIAVELPEAVLNSTHYRMLFLAALSLFLVTFAVNTAAELVRLRFRRRAFQL